MEENLNNLTLAELLTKLKEEKEIGQNEVGRLLEIDTAIVSGLKNGRYKDVNGYEEKIRTFILQELKEEESPFYQHSFINFSFLKRVEGQIVKAILKKKIILLRGISGSGKTTMLKGVANKYKNHVFIQAYKGMSKKELISKVTGSKSSSLEDAQRRVNGKVLFLDEANKLSGGALEWLRSLHDISGISMVWAGTYEDIDDVLYRQPELDRRTRKVYMPEIKEDDLKELVASYNFIYADAYKKLLEERFRGKLGLCVEALNEMKEIVIQKGEKKSVKDAREFFEEKVIRVFE